MKTFRETGTVEGVDGGKAEVLMKAEMAKSCDGCRACAVGFGNVRRMKVDAPAGLKAGDEVVVEVTLPSVYSGILLLFALPIVGLLVGGGVGELAARGMGAADAANTVSIVVGIAGFGLGLLGGYLVGRKIREGLPEPKIAEVRASEGE
jgi:positive regulator of sigma E activity